MKCQRGEQQYVSSSSDPGVAELHTSDVCVWSGISAPEQENPVEPSAHSSVGSTRHVAVS